MKKEFITYWSCENILAKLSEMSWPKARFFHRTTDNQGTKTEIIFPDDITYDHLAFFIGRKTKVTIETID